ANSVAKVGGPFRAPGVLFFVISGQHIVPKGNQPLPLCYALIDVELQQTCSRASLWRSADQAAVIKDKVVCPLLCAWIEEKAKLAGLRVERAEVRAFVPVAAPACVRQVCYIGRTAVLLGNHVVNLMREECDSGRQQTILTTVICPLFNEPAQRCGDIGLAHGADVR